MSCICNSVFSAQVRVPDARMTLRPTQLQSNYAIQDSVFYTSLSPILILKHGLIPMPRRYRMADRAIHSPNNPSFSHPVNLIELDDLYYYFMQMSFDLPVSLQRCAANFRLGCMPYTVVRDGIISQYMVAVMGYNLSRGNICGLAHGAVSSLHSYGQLLQAPTYSHLALCSNSNFT